MVARPVEEVPALPLVARLLGGDSEVCMEVGVLRRSERGLVVEWSPQGRALEPAWNSCSTRELPTSTRLVIEFSTRTPVGLQMVGRCPLTMALEHEIRQLVKEQRRSKLSGGGPRMARPRWQ